VTLQYQLLDPHDRNFAERGERVAHHALGAGRDDRGQAHEGERGRIEVD